MTYKGKGGRSRWKYFSSLPNPMVKKKKALHWRSLPVKAGGSGCFLFTSMKDRRAGGTASDTEAEGHCRTGTPSSRLPHVHQRQGR